MKENSTLPEQSELGKKAEYDPHYNPDKLFPIPRKGKPIVALAEISYGCETPCIIESKSMKLYFNSFAL